MRSPYLFLCLVLSFELASCSGKTGNGEGSDALIQEVQETVSHETVASDLVGTDVDAADLESPDGQPPDTVLIPDVDPGVRMRGEGWLRGDLHQHSSWGGGDDNASIIIAVTKYLEDPAFLLANPEYEGNGFDFISVTDHRITEIATDPLFVSDSLILIPGEEWGTHQHAGLWPVTETVVADPDDDGVSAADTQAAVDATHGQGGLFSMNHAFLPGMEFPFDIRNHDAIEVWNAGWALGSVAYTATDLEAWEAENGPASPFFRKAALTAGIGGSMQALVLYEAQLSRGIHVALVGGSDRHVLFAVGFPTTWVLGESASVDGVIDGIASRRTFVSRGPASSNIDYSVEVGGNSSGVGAAISLGGSTEATITVRVGKADKGLLRIVQGHRVASDEDLADANLESDVLEVPVKGNDFTYTAKIQVQPGDWLLPMVYEPLMAEGLPSKWAKMVPKMAVASATVSTEDYEGLAMIFIDLIDATLLKPKSCDPTKWDPYMLQCMVADPNGIVTYYLPDWVSRTINVILVDGAVTDWCMGAIASAVLFSE